MNAVEIHDTEHSITYCQCDRHTMPLDDFVYVVLDVAKWDKAWSNDKVKYLPADLSELLNDDLGGHAFNRSVSRINALGSYLEKDSEIWGSVLGSGFEIPVTMDDGRHRYWLAREMNLPFFVAAVAVKYLDLLNKMDVQYHTTYSKVFDPSKWTEWSCR